MNWGVTMGNKNGPYNEEYPVGTIVRIIDRDALKHFQQSWKYHNPIEDNQLSYAGQIAKVEEVSFYHGGDELYRLENIPGIWHESCLILNN